MFINLCCIISQLLTDKQGGFEFLGHQSVEITFNKFTDNKNQLQKNQEPELPAIEGIATTIINIQQQQEVNRGEELFQHTNIRDLIQDDQMYSEGFDPFFDSMSIEGNLNNNLGLDHQDKEKNTYDSYHSWIPDPSDDLFSDIVTDSLFDDEMANKEKETPPPSPIPAPPSPVVEEAVEVKTENTDFDLVRYIIFGDVSFEKADDDLEQFLNSIFSQTQNADFLTPTEEKSCPIFEQQPQLPVIIKSEPVASTSAAPSPRPSPPATEDVSTKSSRRRAPKRRYSSDSDFSVQTSASSFNATTSRSSKKKRGRPAKELITELPTVDDFKHMPIEQASHFVLRIKNNEASRKSRMKSKSKQNAYEDECDRLNGRKNKLRTKQNRLEGQIQTLRQWLLGIH